MCWHRGRRTRPSVRPTRPAVVGVAAEGSRLLLGAEIRETVLSRGPGTRRSSQRAALPLEGWDIALQLDEDPRIGSSLIECLEYTDGARIFALVDVAVPGMPGVVLASRLRGVIVSRGILAADSGALLQAILEEFAGQPEELDPVGVLLAELHPSSPEVRVVARRHTGALHVRSRRRGQMEENGMGSSAGSPIVLEPPLVAGSDGVEAVRGTTITMEPRDALILVSRFSCGPAWSGAGDPALGEKCHDSLPALEAEVLKVSAPTAIDGVVSLGSRLRERAGSRWTDHLLSVIWFRCVAMSR